MQKITCNDKTCIYNMQLECIAYRVIIQIKGKNSVCKTKEKEVKYDKRKIVK
jgi:hypothetical protein